MQGRISLCTLQLWGHLRTTDAQCSFFSSGIPEAETFGRNRKFSAFGFRFRPPKLKAEYGRNYRKALDFFFPSVFQDEIIIARFY